MRKLLWIPILLLAASPVRAQVSIATKDLPSDLEAVSLTAVKDGNTFLVWGPGAGGEVLLKTTNGGQQFSVINTMSTDPFRAMFRVTGDTIISIGQVVERSVDFGDYWSTLQNVPGGDYYYLMADMPNGRRWLAKRTFDGTRLYETDHDFTSFYQKYPVPLPGDIRFLSDVSADTVYFMSRDTAGILWLYKTEDNGNSWTTSSILEQFDSPFSLPRISNITYHSASSASVFCYNYGAPDQDNFTTDGFASLIADPVFSVAHQGHEVIDWVKCDGRNFLVYDASEISSPGIQEVTHNSDGSITAGTYQFFGLSYHQSLNHYKDALTVGGGDTSITLVTGICSPTTIKQTPVLAETSVFPNPTEGRLFIRSVLSSISWEVYNCLGALIQKGTAEHIDIAAQPAGIYMVRLTGANKSGQTEQIKIDKK